MRRFAAALALLLLLPASRHLHAQDVSSSDDSAFSGGNLTAAIAQASQAIDADPTDENAYMRRGRLYFANAEYDLAIRDFTHVLQDDAANAPALFQRARSYFRSNDLDNAIADYNQFLQLRPNSAPAYVNRGAAYLRKRDYDSAIADESEALRLKPDAGFAFINRAHAYRLTGNYDDALADLGQALHLDPNRAATYLAQGITHRLKGDAAGARADFEAALKLDPHSVFANNALAWQMASCPDAKFRDGKAAVTYAMKACELGQWLYPGPVDTLATAYAEAGDFDSAVKWENKFLEYTITEDVANKARARLALFEAHQPYHRQDELPPGDDRD